MKIILFRNTNNLLNLNSIEIFGLPKAGKTTLLNKLADSGRNKINFENVSLSKKLFLFLKYFIKHPLKTSYLFYKMNTKWQTMKGAIFKDYFDFFRMRNSYLSAVLAKYELIASQKKIFYIDEFIFQSLFVIFQVRASKEEILTVLTKLPASGKILLMEETKRERYLRWRAIKEPARNLNTKYRMLWWNNMEANYKIIKDILEKKYGPPKNIANVFKELPF